MSERDDPPDPRRRPSPDSPDSRESERTGDAWRPRAPRLGAGGPTTGEDAEGRGEGAARRPNRFGAPPPLRRPARPEAPPPRTAGTASDDRGRDPAPRDMPSNAASPEAERTETEQTAADPPTRDAYPDVPPPAWRTEREAPAAPRPEAPAETRAPANEVSPPPRAPAEPAPTDAPAPESRRPSLRERLRQIQDPVGTPARETPEPHRPADQRSEPERRRAAPAAETPADAVSEGGDGKAAAPPASPTAAPRRPGPTLVASNAGLEVHSLGKSFKKRPVLRDVSLSVQRGEAVGLLGPNGAGKTTCFYIVTGLISADYGEIKLDGEDITELPMYRRSRLGIGYLPQEASIFRGLTVEQNIMAVLELIEKDRGRRESALEALMAEFSISHLRRTPAIALSGGERRRLEIARALASQPHFVLLDEPLAGIDPIAVRDIRELVSHLKDRGIGVLITDHNVRETLDIVDRAYILHGGTVLMEGAPDDIVANQEVRRVYLGDRFSL